VRPPGPMEHGDHRGIGGRRASGSFALCPLCRLWFARAGQGVGRLPPFPSCLLARQDKATGTRACELHEPSYADREKDGRAESDFLG
jgi:hypothetical protein